MGYGKRIRRPVFFSNEVDTAYPAYFAPSFCGEFIYYRKSFDPGKKSMGETD
ncbi:hypothetical protein D3C78_1211590 [compost metagenome]